MKKLVRLILCAACVFAHACEADIRQLNVNGFAGPVCTVEVTDETTVLQVKEQLSANKDVPVQDTRYIALLHGTQKLADESVVLQIVTPETDSLKMVVSKWFVEVRDGRITFRDTNFAPCLLLNCQGCRARFTPGTYTIDQLFDEAENLWRRENPDKNFPGMRFYFGSGLFQSTFFISKYVLNKIAQTGILNIFSRYTYDPLFNRKMKAMAVCKLHVTLFSFVIRSWGAVHDTRVPIALQVQDIAMEDLTRLRDQLRDHSENCREALRQLELLNAVFGLVGEQ